MIMKPLISVIVPIYNVEQYLPRCIESILNQTYKNLEIILVDDGATDRCGSICDAYKEKDCRVKVIHKPNGGLSDARNTGLDQMTGEYVTCIDSDDFVSPYFVSNLWSALEEKQCDIASSWFIEYHNGQIVPTGRIVDIQEVEVLAKNKYFERLLYQDGVEISAWGKLYKSSLYRNVRYPVGKLYEDIPTTYRLIEQAKKIAVISNIDYYYFQRENSIARAKFSIRKMDAIYHMHIFGNFIQENYPELVDAFKCRYFNTVCNILFQINDSSFQQQKTLLWNEIKKYRFDVLENKHARKKTRIAAIISYGGQYLMRRVYDWNKRQHG